MPQAGTPRRCFWRWCRASFRWCRILCLTLILLVLAALTWLRLVGLPDFLRERIVAELAQRGVNAGFSSLRFHWFRGLVARDLQVAWGGTNGPRVTIAEADLDIAPPPWKESKDLVRGLAIRSGTLVLPLPLTNEPIQNLVVEQVSADIRFLPGDAWEVRRLGAELLGLNLELRASLTNLAMLGRKKPASPTEASRLAAAERIRVVRTLVDEVGRWSIPNGSRLEVSLHLDGNDPQRADGNMYLNIPEVRAPQGTLHGLRFSTRVRPAPAGTDAAAAETNSAGSSVTFGLAELQTEYGSIGGVSGRLEFTGPPRPALPTNVTWHVNAGQVSVRGFRARRLSLDGTNELGPLTRLTRDELAQVPVVTRLRATAERIEAAEVQKAPVKARSANVSIEAHHWISTNLPASVLASVEAAMVEGKPGSLSALSLKADLRRGAETRSVPAGIAWWTPLWAWQGGVDITCSGLQAPGKLSIAELEMGLDWAAPRASIRRLDARLYGGTLAASGSVDALTREGRLKATTTFDLHGLDAMFGPRSRENFTRYQWVKPPRFDGSLRVMLPPWDDPRPDWDGAVKDSMQLEARFKVGAGSFKGVLFDTAESSVSYDGTSWKLPNLHTSRPEGTQEIAVDYNEETREYRIDARGIAQPPVLKPLLGEQCGEVLDLFQFKEPVEAVVTVWGPWTEGTRQAIAGNIRATNFTFRGQSFDRLEATLGYTNRFLAAAPVRINREAGELVAEGVGYDFAEGRLWLTNIQNTIQPSVVAAAISEGFPEKLKHYTFDAPPLIKVNGTLRPLATESADLAFDIAGGPFHFWRFTTGQIATRLLWQGQVLTLTNLQAAFYRGSLEGNAVFDLSDPEDGRYQFSAKVRDSQLGELLQELTAGKTNVAHGNFDLDLRIDSARTSDLGSWSGDGSASLRDGLLWDTPIFGFLSPVLNGVSPGLGNSRAKRAEATFIVTNGVFNTRDLTISCPPARLLYRGTIDFDQRVNAKVEGQVLSEIGGLGPLFGLVLRPLTKLLEFRVTGTLSKVDADPLYIPKFLFLPLAPVRAFFGIFGSGADKDRPPAAVTNAVPAPVPAPDIPKSTTPPPAQPPP